jgi:peroxiredoxin
LVPDYNRLPMKAHHTHAITVVSNTARANRQTGKTVLIAVAALVALAVVGSLIVVFTKPQMAPTVTFKTITGQQITSDSLKGKLVLVNFWATSCVSCIAEMPKLVQTYERNKGKGYETVAVAMSYDRPDFVMNFATRRALPFPVALDLDGNLAKQFGDVKITPTNILINEKGQIIKRWVGEPDFAQIQQWVDARKG